MLIIEFIKRCFKLGKMKNSCIKCLLIFDHTETDTKATTKINQPSIN